MKRADSKNRFVLPSRPLAFSSGTFCSPKISKNRVTTCEVNPNFAANSATFTSVSRRFSSEAFLSAINYKYAAI
jgi:hypothetical protein